MKKIQINSPTKDATITLGRKQEKKVGKKRKDNVAADYLNLLCFSLLRAHTHALLLKRENCD